MVDLPTLQECARLNTALTATPYFDFRRAFDVKGWDINRPRSAMSVDKFLFLDARYSWVKLRRRGSGWCAAGGCVNLSDFESLVNALNKMNNGVGDAVPMVHTSCCVFGRSHCVMLSPQRDLPDKVWRELYALMREFHASLPVWPSLAQGHALRWCLRCVPVFCVPPELPFQFAGWIFYSNGASLVGEKGDERVRLNLTELGWALESCALLVNEFASLLSALLGLKLWSDMLHA